MPEANAPAAPAAPSGSSGQPTPAPSAAPGGAPGSTDKGAEQSTLLNGGKPADASASAEGAGDKDAGAEGSDDKGGAPESYTFEAPEGVELDQTAASEFSEVAKDLKLSAADAQRIADVAVKMAQRQTEAFAATVKEWETQSRADAEFGGDALEANMAIAQKALDTYGSPKLGDTLKAFGLLNHPEVIRVFFKIGKATQNDSFAKGGSAATTNVPLANRLYPHQN